MFYSICKDVQHTLLYISEQPFCRLFSLLFYFYFSYRLVLDSNFLAMSPSNINRNVIVSFAVLLDTAVCKAGLDYFEHPIKTEIE